MTSGRNVYNLAFKIPASAAIAPDSIDLTHSIDLFEVATVTIAHPCRPVGIYHNRINNA